MSPVSRRWHRFGLEHPHRPVKVTKMEDTPVEMKDCRKCNSRKPVDWFIRKKDGREMPFCSTCRRNYAIEMQGNLSPRLKGGEPSPS